MSAEIRRLIESALNCAELTREEVDEQGLSRLSWRLFVMDLEQQLALPAQQEAPPAPPVMALVDGLKDAVETARNYYMLFHDEQWKARLMKWEAALKTAPVVSDPAREEETKP